MDRNRSLDRVGREKRHEKKKRRRSSSSSSSSSSTSSSSSRSRSKSSKKSSHKSQDVKTQRKKRRRSSSSSSSSTSSSSSPSSSSSDEKTKKKKTEKPPSYLEVWQSEEGTVELGPVMTDEQKARLSTKRPLTKEEYEARQSVIRRVVDPETGRTRLVRGEGEIIEEIVSREKHKDINKQATKGDGNAFQRKLGINK
ncbi:hypothetical protein PFLUV_G00070790 [Perca fluviatilis]|uniref:ADP-ribosylation factor-like protein 6-interacting protein 4 n=1 Tax=Perca fluviatilis TaxID=8168 RepID=A0A6A5FK37_PERFL|nr:hypothetical protein PFLUV_G00070790 [Perca fluviatilis]